MRRAAQRKQEKIQRKRTKRRDISLLFHYRRAFKNTGYQRRFLKQDAALQPTYSAA